MNRILIRIVAATCAVIAVAGIAYRNEIGGSLKPTYYLDTPWGVTIVTTPWGKPKEIRIERPRRGLPTVSDPLHPIILPDPEFDIGLILDDSTVIIKRVSNQSKPEWQKLPYDPSPVLPPTAN